MKINVAIPHLAVREGENQVMGYGNQAENPALFIFISLAQVGASKFLSN